MESREGKDNRVTSKERESAVTENRGADERQKVQFKIGKWWVNYPPKDKDKK